MPLIEVAGLLLLVGGVVEGEVVFSLFVFVVFEVNHLLELFNVVLEVKLDGRRRLRDSVRVNCICCGSNRMDERFGFVCSFMMNDVDFVFEQKVCQENQRTKQVRMKKQRKKIQVRIQVTDAYK